MFLLCCWFQAVYHFFKDLKMLKLCLIYVLGSERPTFVLFSPPLTGLCRSTDLSFDLSPLTKAEGGFYNLSNGNYDFYINVCDPVKASTCPEKAGACQVEQKDGAVDK